MKQMKSFIGRYPFEVETFQVDYTGGLSFGFLANKMLISAGNHANERGFGKERLGKDGKTWVLSRLVIEMYEYPSECEKYYVDTWVESVTRLFTSRNFRVLVSDERVIGYARSTWALIDVVTRQPADLTTLYDGELAAYCHDEECPIKGASRTRVMATEPTGSFAPLYCDIDYNGHLNSVKYIEHILNELPLEIFRTHTIHRVEVSYSAECFYREQLSIFMDKKDDGHEYDVEIRKDNGDVACRAKILFKPTSNPASCNISNPIK